MNKILLRSLFALVLLAITIIAISCTIVHQQGIDDFRCEIKKVESDRPGPAAAPRNSRLRICPFPLDAQGLAALKLKLGNNKSLYKIRFYQNGKVTETLGTLSSTLIPSGQTEPDLSPHLIAETEKVENEQEQLFNGVTIQAGRGRGGSATIKPSELKKDQDLVERVETFFASP